MKRSLLRRFLDADLRTKYLAAVLLLLIATALSSSYLLSRNVQSSYQVAYQDAMSDMTDIYDQVSRFERRMTHLSTIVQNNETALDLLRDIQNLDLQSFEPVRQKITPILFSLHDGSGDYDCRLYVRAKNDFIDSTARILLLPDPAKESWVQSAMQGWGWRSFYSPRELNAASPALLAPVRDAEHVQDLIGLLRIDISPDALRRMMTPVRSGSCVSCYLETPGGDIVAQSGLPLASTEYLSGLSESEWSGFQAGLLHETKGKNEALLYQRLPVSGWMMVMVFHRNLLLRQIWSEQTGVVLFSVALILAGVLIALPILWHAVKRIRRFHAHVQRYSADSMKTIPPRLEPLAHDEIGSLIEAHNAMLDHIQQLMKEKSQQEEEMRRLEIFALQAQIKPHFLYNTLEAIGWMARLHMPDKVDSAIHSLTAFYRLCLSSGQDILSVEKELEIVRNYFAVACMRYESRYELKIDVADEALDVLLPKLTLQPLVENALMHGLLESEQGAGTIRIFTRRAEDGGMELCIADSGAHFSQQAWTRIFRHPESFDGNGYGLKNVERRLCLYYTRDSVMHLDLSDPGWSVIVIPLRSV